MLTLPANFAARNEAVDAAPIYVIELAFASGQIGTEGVNDVYLASADVSRVLNLPYPDRWFPILDASKISGITQRVDPINGVSSIGKLSASMLDADGMFTAIVKSADAIGQGLRRQLCRLYALFDGQDWADRVLVRTLFVDDLRLEPDGATYTLTASDAQAALKRNLFQPKTSFLTGNVPATGAATIQVADSKQFAAVSNHFYGTGGWIKIGSEIMRWTTNANNQLTVAASDRGLFGTTPAAHSANDKVQEVIVLRENPITMALRVMTSTGTGTNGPYDTLPAHWGAGFQHVNVAEWEAVGALLVGLDTTVAAPESTGYQFEFVISRPEEAKKFIEAEICKIIGAFPRIKGDGTLGLVAYNDLANAVKENAPRWLTVDDAIKWTALRYDYTALANELWIDYDPLPKDSSKFQRAALFVDSVSRKKWGGTKQLTYKARGVIASAAYVDQLYQRFQRVMARYSRPPMRLGMTLLPKHADLEVGDIVRVTLPIKDATTGLDLDRAFEVLTVGWDMRGGHVTVELIAQPEKAALWQNGVGAIASLAVSPASASIGAGNTVQLHAIAYDANGNQVQAPAVLWTTSDPAIATVDANGLVTGVAAGAVTITAVAGAYAATASITVTAAATTNPVASVQVSPSTVGIAPGATQQLTAVSLDVNGAIVPGRTYSWASDNAAVATVDATGLVTGVAAGSANVTATDTGANITSPPVAVTVRTLQPTYTPPVIADSAYQIGTQITTMGPVGGPHTIPNGYSFAAGDYWFDGDVVLPQGSICYINGTVRIFALGAVTINGTIDGRGRGLAGGPAYTGDSLTTGYHGDLSRLSSTQRSAHYGAGVGFLGRGGDGGGSNIYNVALPTAYLFHGGSTLYQAQPSIAISGKPDANGTWTSVQGLPTELRGSGGGAEFLVLRYGSTYTGRSGGNGGAGLLIMARGIFLASPGLIDVRGADGGPPLNPMATPLGTYFGVGGGGGGTAVLLAERDPQGLPVLAVDQTRIYVAGGAASDYGSVRSSSWVDTSSAATWTPLPNFMPVGSWVRWGSPGTPGAIYAQVIG